MKKVVFYSFGWFSFYYSLSTEASAQRGVPKINRRALLDSLSPEQKKELRTKMRARYDSLSPEQKDRVKDQLKSKMDSLSPQEKKKLRQQLRKRKADGGSE
jgi:hypothetical protein